MLINTRPVEYPRYSTTKARYLNRLLHFVSEYCTKFHGVITRTSQPANNQHPTPSTSTAHKTTQSPTHTGSARMWQRCSGICDDWRSSASFFLIGSNVYLKPERFMICEMSLLYPNPMRTTLQLVSLPLLQAINIDLALL